MVVKKLSLSLSKMISQKNTSMINSINNATAEIKKYADVNDFINLRPSIGINGETKMPVSIDGLKLTIGYNDGIMISLGGYCSKYPKTVINLPANKTSYVYLRRNASDRHKIDTEIRETTIGAEGQVAFNFFMAGKFITNSSSVTSNVIYTVR